MPVTLLTTTKQALVDDWTGTTNGTTTNNGVTLGAGGTSLSIASATSDNGSGVILPSGAPFRLRLRNAGNTVEEWCTATRSGTILTLSGRGEDSPAASWVSGTIVEAVPTVAGLADWYENNIRGGYDYEVYFDGVSTCTAKDLRHGGVIATAADAGSLINKIGGNSQKLGPVAGTENMNSGGCSIIIHNRGSDMSKIPMLSTDYIGKVYASGSAGVVSGGSQNVLTDAGQAFTDDVIGRLVFIAAIDTHGGVPNSSEHVATITARTATTLTMAKATDNTGTNLKWTIPTINGVKLYSTVGGGSAHVGNEHPDYGGAILQAQGSGWGSKSVVDYRNAVSWTGTSFGTMGFEMHNMTIDPGTAPSADWSLVGYGYGLGGVCKFINCHFMVGNVGGYGLGNFSDSGGNSDTIFQNCQIFDQPSAVSKTWQGGTVALPQLTHTYNNTTNIPAGPGFIEVVSLAPGAATDNLPTGGGSIDVGDHFWGVAYVTAAGTTAIGPPTTGRTIGANKTEGLTAVPIGPTGVTQRKIYRTKANAPTIASGRVPRQDQWFLAGTIADNITTTFSDSGSDVSLGANPPATGSGTQLISYGAVGGGGTTLTGCAGGAGIMVNGQTVKYYAYGAVINLGDQWHFADTNVATDSHALMLNLASGVRGTISGGHWGGGGGGVVIVVAGGKHITFKEMYIDNIESTGSMNGAGIWVCPMTTSNTADVKLGRDTYFHINDSGSVPVVLDGANAGAADHQFVISGQCTGDNAGTGSQGFVKFVNGWVSGRGVQMKDIASFAMNNLYTGDGSSPAIPDKIDGNSINISTGTSSTGDLNVLTSGRGIPITIPSMPTTAIPPPDSVPPGSMVFDSTTGHPKWNSGTAWTTI